MGKFDQRSTQLEIMDDPSISAEELRLTLKELAVINRLLGGHSATLQALNMLNWPKGKPLHIIDCACGGGDTIAAMAAWAKAKGVDARFTGVDLNQHCVDFALQEQAHLPAVFLQADVLQLPNYNLNGDVVTAALFLHHLYDANLRQIIQAMYATAGTALIINDLHRHPFAYYSIKWLTRLLSRSRLIKNDAPLSVNRAFSKKDLLNILLDAGIPRHQIHITWVWAFRWRVLVLKR